MDGNAETASVGKSAGLFKWDGRPDAVDVGCFVMIQPRGESLFVLFVLLVTLPSISDWPIQEG